MALDADRLAKLIVGDAAIRAAADVGHDAAVLEALNAGMTPLAVNTLMSVLTTSIGTVMAHPSLTRIITDIRAQDRDAVRMWAVALAAGANPTITTQERDAILGALAKPASMSLVEHEFGAGTQATMDDVTAALAPLRVDAAVASYKAGEWPAVSVYVTPERMATEGIDATHLAAAKASNERTIEGVEPVLRAGALQLIQARDATLAKLLTDEAATLAAQGR